MKILINLTIISCFMFAFAACNDDGEVRDLNVTAVTTLYEPDNGKAVVLQASASASLYFEWEPARAEDSGMVLYELAFDKADGDFSNPVFIMAADNNSGSNHATITHKQLNKIAAMAGIETASEGTLKWTVYSSKGINPVKALQERTLTLTRLAGLADIPDNLYITGEATENGADLSKALIMKRLSDGEFEIYTRLTEGKEFKFVSATSGTPLEFSLSGEQIVVGGTSSVTQTGVYKYYLDFNTGAYTHALVTRICFYFSPDNAILFDLPYVGNGVFRADAQTVTFKQESWGRDQRYKFRMFVKENGGADPETEYEWGTLSSTDSPPTATSPDAYYFIKLLTSTSQWDNKWKLMSGFDGVAADYTVYLQADKQYTHSVK